jgi:RNA polymerase sigma factor for flagellar operon FliA
MDAASAAIAAHRSLVRRLAMQEVWADIPGALELDDLVQAGLIGVHDALQRYDPDVGASAETWVRARALGAMLDTLRASDWVSRADRATQRTVAAARQQAEHELCRAVSIAEVAARAGMSSDDLHALHDRLDSAAGWLDAAPDTIDKLPADVLSDPAVRLQRRQDVEAVIAAVERLPDNYRRMMKMIYEDDMTLEAVGAELGVSDSRVSQMHRKAVERVAQACAVRRVER